MKDSDTITNGLKSLNLVNKSRADSQQKDAGTDYKFEFSCTEDDNDDWVDDDFDIDSVLKKSAGTAIDENDWEDTDSDTEEGYKAGVCKLQTQTQTQTQTRTRTGRGTQTTNSTKAKAGAKARKGQPVDRTADRTAVKPVVKPVDKAVVKDSRRREDELARQMGLSAWVPPIGAEQAEPAECATNKKAKQQKKQKQKQKNATKGEHDATKKIIRIHYTDKPQDNNNKHNQSPQSHVTLASRWAGDAPSDAPIDSMWA